MNIRLVSRNNSPRVKVMIHVFSYHNTYPFTDPPLSFPFYVNKRAEKSHLSMQQNKQCRELRYFNSMFLSISSPCSFAQSLFPTKTASSHRLFLRHFWSRGINVSQSSRLSLERYQPFRLVMDIIFSS